MFDNKGNTKKCDIRFQAISVLARLQRIKREEYSTVKVCNLVFLCVGSNSYRYIHLSNIAFLLGAETYTIVCSFHFGDDDFGSIVLYCLLIVVGSF